MMISIFERPGYLKCTRKREGRGCISMPPTDDVLKTHKKLMSGVVLGRIQAVELESIHSQESILDQGSVFGQDLILSQEPILLLNDCHYSMKDSTQP